jgi:hypothetical protein
MIVNAELRGPWPREWRSGDRDLRSGRIAVVGPPSLARALPRWNRLSGWANLGIKPMTA